MTPLEERIEWVLKARNLSSDALSKKAGMSRGYIRNTVKLAKTGEANPTLEAMAKIARAANVSTRWLMLGVEPREPFVEGEDPQGLASTVDRSTSQVQPHHATLSQVQGYEAAVVEAQQLWPDLFAPDIYEESRGVSGFAFPDQIDAYTLRKILETIVEIRATKKRNAERNAAAGRPADRAHMSDRQARLLDELDAEDAAADAAYEAAQKAKAVGAESTTPKPVSATRKKGKR